MQPFTTRPKECYVRICKRIIHFKSIIVHRRCIYQCCSPVVRVHVEVRNLWKMSMFCAINLNQSSASEPLGLKLNYGGQQPRNQRSSQELGTRQLLFKILHREELSRTRRGLSVERKKAHHFFMEAAHHIQLTNQSAWINCFKTFASKPSAEIQVPCNKKIIRLEKLRREYLVKKINMVYLAF